MRFVLIAACFLFLLACKAVPTDANRNQLLVSNDVKDIFEEEGLDELEADGERVRCERHRRVGTHMVTRVCLTVAEWDERERARETHEDHRAFPPCISIPSAGASAGPGGSVQSTCGGEGRAR